MKQNGTRSWVIRAASIVTLASAAFASACSDTDPVSPLLPPEPPSNPNIISAAWIFDVLGTKREIRVTPPSRGLNGPQDLQILADYFGLEAGHPELSIVAGDVVNVLADNTTLAFSPVGQFIPGYIRVTFDVAVQNKLSAVNLITPTFPAPPAGTSGVLLFPFETSLININNQNVTGGGGDGTEVVVELPNQGLVAPSVDWDGAPHNFFNDSACLPSDNDCYRFETFGDPLAGGATSAYSTIGFDAEATVSQFRFRGIVAADLADATPNTPPVADVGGPYTGEIPAAVALSAAASTDPDGTIASYAWDLDNDGSFDDATGVSASFTCSTPGTFPVAVRVTDNRSATADDASTVTCAFGPANVSITAVAQVAGAPVASVVENTAFNWVVTVTNPGTAPVSGIVVTSDIDDAATITGAGTGTVGAGNVVTFPTFSLTGGASSTFTIAVTAEAAAASPSTNVATLASPDDTNPADNTASASVAVTAPANVFGVWTNASNAAITSATVGSTVFLQICTTVADTQAYQNFLTFPVALASVASGASDLNAVTTGAGACASTGTDVNTEFTGGPLVSPYNFQNFSLSATPGTGAQGMGRIPFTLNAAGSLVVDITVTTLATFAGGTPTAVVSIPALTIN